MAIPDGFAEVTLKFNALATDHYAFNVFLVANGAPTLEVLSDNVRTDLDESLMAVVSEDWDLREIRVVDSDDFWFVNNDALPGEFDGPAVAPNTAFLLKKVTAKIGKTNRGRLYLPGVPESAVNAAGAVDGTFLTDVTNLAESFLAKLEADDIPMYIRHKGDMLTPTAVQHLICDPFVATQRRRLR